jgi:hypothetical protein
MTSCALTKFPSLADCDAYAAAGTDNAAMMAIIEIIFFICYSPLQLFQLSFVYELIVRLNYGEIMTYFKKISNLCFIKVA